MRPQYRLGVDESRTNRLIYHENLIGDRLRHNSSYRWMADIEPSVKDEMVQWPAAVSGDLLYEEIHATEAYFVYRSGGLLINLELSRKFVFIELATDDKSLMAAELQRIKRLFPVEEPTGDQVPVTFWMHARNGPRSFERNLDMPTWSDIQANYPVATREQVTRLMGDAMKHAHGQLILWHGEPGTGKTYALRALLREWHKWCKAQYIIDTDAFFAGSADYLMQVILSEEQTNFAARREYMAMGLDPDDQDDKDKWKLLIFEDAGELLSADAKERVGQGLARLLNVVDGMIGQGLKLLTLITTNEEVGRMHPAVIRPGRTAANIDFGTFSMIEANEWLQANGYEGNVGSSRTLAEMYRLLEPDAFKAPERLSVGFAPR